MVKVANVLIAIALVFILFLIIQAYRFRNPYKLIMIFGKKGSGKTTLLTKLSLMYNKAGRPVYSSTPIPGTYLFDPCQLGLDALPEGAVIFIDEVGMIWDNRNFKGFKDHTRDYFKLQRHYKHTVYLFSQSFDVDKKIRDLTDQMYLVRSFCGFLSIARRILRDITIVSPEQNQGESKLVDSLKFDSLLFFWCGSVKFTYIPRYVKYFNSYDVPQLKDAEYQYIPFPEFKKVQRKLPDRLLSPLIAIRQKLDCLFHKLPFLHFDDEGYLTKDDDGE